MTESSNQEENSLDPEPKNYLDKLADALLAGDDVDVYSAAAGTDEVDALMEQLIRNGSALQPERLLALSDLSQRSAARVRQDWPLVPADRRQAILRYLLDIAEEDLGIHLGPILRIALSDREAEVRRLAIDGLWEDSSEDLIGPLVQRLLNDTDVNVRAAAARALGAFVLAGELDELDTALAMRVEEALLSILLRPEEPLAVRRYALEAIAYSGEAGVRQLIEDAYYDPDETMRVSALVAMARSADIRWRGLVRAELQNPSAAMRSEAAAACGELDARAAQHELIDLLADEEQQVRLAAIGALGQLGGKDAREALRMISAGEDAAEAEAADLALEEMLFLQENADIALYDEGEMLTDWEQDPWDQLYDDEDFGEYEA